MKTWIKYLIISILIILLVSSLKGCVENLLPQKKVIKPQIKVVNVHPKATKVVTSKPKKVARDEYTVTTTVIPDPLQYQSLDDSNTEIVVTQRLKLPSFPVNRSIGAYASPRTQSAGYGIKLSGLPFVEADTLAVVMLGRDVRGNPIAGIGIGVAKETLPYIYLVVGVMYSSVEEVEIFTGINYSF